MIFFFYEESKSKKKNYFLCVCVWGGGGGGGGGTNRPKLRSWGHNNALMYQSWPRQAQFMTILSFNLQV